MSERSKEVIDWRKSRNTKTKRIKYWKEKCSFWNKKWLSTERICSEFEKASAYLVYEKLNNYYALNQSTVSLNLLVINQEGHFKNATGRDFCLYSLIVWVDSIRFLSGISESIIEVHTEPLASQVPEIGDSKLKLYFILSHSVRDDTNNIWASTIRSLNSFFELRTWHSIKAASRLISHFPEEHRWLWIIEYICICRPFKTRILSETRRD